MPGAGLPGPDRQGERPAPALHRAHRQLPPGQCDEQAARRQQDGGHPEGLLDRGHLRSCETASEGLYWPSMSEDHDRTASLMTPGKLAQMKPRPAATPAAWLDRMASDA